MNIEVNPFQQTIPVGTTAITSITVESNLDWLVIPDVALGANAIVNLNAETTPPLKVFGTGVGTGVPSMISLVASHIPNIEISQVNGLQGELASQLGSLEGSIETAIEVTNNGSGDYLIVPHFGGVINTLAQGDDVRFSAPVTGIRLGAGDAMFDAAAVARVDYWDVTEFTGGGTIGLVPDPIAIGTTRYLREDGTWVAPAGSGTVSSVGLVLPTAVFNIAGSPVTASGDITVTFDNQNAGTFFAGPAIGSPATPAFRGIGYSDTAPFVGTTSSTIAAGNDTRFPASVTGIRKSAGAGSTDTAAVSGVDYAAATVFGGKGPSHAKGLVPDPGTGTSPYTRWLREDSTWQVFTPSPASITNSMLSTASARTLKANATGSTASVTDVDAKTARSGSLLNIESQTTFGNVDYAALDTDRHIVTSATFTAPRSVTLPLANSFNAGQYILIADDFGAINGTYYLKVTVQGGDNIQGSASDYVIKTKYGSVKLDSDGNNQWNITECSPPVSRMYYTGSQTYTTPTGIKSIFVECIAGGGGGGAAVASGSNASAAGGGGGGGYSNKLISSPAVSYSITVGNGGTGGVSGGPGGTGDDTDFGGLVTSTGGAGGEAMTVGSTPEFSLGGYGGYATSGDWGAEGSTGGMGTRLSGTVAASGFGGAAASYGGGVQGLTSENEGNLGCRYGGGGSGALSTTVTDRSGGDGQQGIVIVTEFF